MKVAVVGANGQLGSDLVDAFEVNGNRVFGLTHADVEISDIQSVERALEGIQPQVIVNTAAMHHVENCESDPERAFAVNALGARNLAKVARKFDGVLVHVSTDYVFDGCKGKSYTEIDTPRPLNAYGTTKLAGEYFVRATAPKHFVVRTSGLYGKSACRAKGGLNFVELMIKLARERGQVSVVDSEVVSPTATAELARQIVGLSHSSEYGLYHATAEGSCSWYEFAQEIFAATGTEVRLQVAGPSEFPTKVARPTYSVLENQALKASGLNLFKSWQEALHDYLADRMKTAVTTLQ